MKDILLFILCFFFIQCSFSQSISRDSLIGLQVSNALRVYNQFTDGNAPLFKGTEYIYYSFKMDGDPYFKTGNQTSGWVGYEGRVYAPINLFYDIARNQVVIQNNDSLAHIVLQNELIDSFHLLGHTFIMLNENHQQNLYNTGFYDVLFKGKILLMARRIKTMDEVIDGNSLLGRFFEKDRFYVYKNGLYYLVTNKREAFHLYGDKKTEVRRSLRHLGVKVRRKNFEEALLKSIEIYDQLIK